jgi:CBS domain-containing protein
MKIVKDILQAKGHEIWSISPDRSVYDALTLMAEKNVGALVVMETDRVIGIISERDYARKVILKGKSSKELAVQEIMTPRVVCVRPEQTMEECMELMTDKHIRHLPVLDENRLVGLISIGDVVKAIIAEKEFIIGQLEGYITGNR